MISGLSARLAVARIIKEATEAPAKVNTGAEGAASLTAQFSTSAETPVEAVEAVEAAEVAEEDPPGNQEVEELLLLLKLLFPAI